MARPPIIVSTSPQPTTSTAPRVPATGQHITFVGSLTNGVDSVSHSFAVLAGDGAPTVVGGFAKWNVIDRPQRVGYTVHAGYDPIVLDVPILFDAVARGTQNVEADIKKLEWMGGRGTLFNADRGVGRPGMGDSPLVRVFTSDTRGLPNSLVPSQFQTDNLLWVVTGLQYDAMPLRDLGGDRIRQKINVTLTEFVGAPGSSADSSSTRQRARRNQANQFRLVAISRQHNTIRKVAVFDCHNPTHAAAVAILEANRSNPRLHLGRSVDQDLSRLAGVRLKVPLNVIRPL